MIEIHNLIDKPLKILIMRLSALGDIVNLTVIFSKIREKYPHAEIHFLTKTQFQDIVNPNNYGIKIISFDSSKGLRGWLEICADLKKEKYDWFLDMHNNIRSRILGLYLSKVKGKKFVKPRIRRLLLFYFLINCFSKKFNLISEYLKVLKILGIDSNYGYTEIKLRDSVIQKSKDILKSVGIKKDFVVILPIAAWKNKRYDLNRYLQLSEKIVSEYKMQVVWLGGKSDEYLNEINIKNEQIIKMLGQTILMESMAILKQAKFVIGNDTGLIYASQALGTPSLIIEGPTSRETGAGHCQNGSKVLETTLWCRPCSQKGDRKCYRTKQHCLDFTVKEVYSVFNQIVTGENQ